MADPSTARTEVVIDLNVRVAGDRTYSGFEDVRGPMPQVGEAVRAVEDESGLAGPAVVTDLDEGKRLIFLAVAWKELRPMTAADSTEE